MCIINDKIDKYQKNRISLSQLATNGHILLLNHKTILRR